MRPAPKVHGDTKDKKRKKKKGAYHGQGLDGAGDDGRHGGHGGHGSHSDHSGRLGGGGGPTGLLRHTGELIHATSRGNGLKGVTLDGLHQSEGYQAFGKHNQLAILVLHRSQELALVQGPAGVLNDWRRIGDLLTGEGARLLLGHLAKLNGEIDARVARGGGSVEGIFQGKGCGRGRGAGACDPALMDVDDGGTVGNLLAPRHGGLQGDLGRLGNAVGEGRGGVGQPGRLKPHLAGQVDDVEGDVAERLAVVGEGGGQVGVDLVLLSQGGGGPHAQGHVRGGLGLLVVGAGDVGIAADQEGGHGALGVGVGCDNVVEGRITRGRQGAVGLLLGGGQGPAGIGVLVQVDAEELVDGLLLGGRLA